jgi:hypothetical protein
MEDSIASKRYRQITDERKRLIQELSYMECPGCLRFTIERRMNEFKLRLEKDK